MPRLLSLFDGTGAISRPFAAGGWKVQNLDIDGTHGATLTTDILKWDNLAEPKCDVLFAGCPCEAYMSRIQEVYGILFWQIPWFVGRGKSSSTFCNSTQP